MPGFFSRLPSTPITKLQGCLRASNLLQGLEKVDNVPRMKFFGRAAVLAAATLVMLVCAHSQTPAQAQARRLILKDGTYQSVTKYEVQGDRVRYFSAERGSGRKFPIR